MVKCFVHKSFHLLDYHAIINFVFQVKAQEKADFMLELIGYPDWLPEKADLDKYYAGVSISYIEFFCQSSKSIEKCERFNIPWKVP